MLRTELRAFFGKLPGYEQLGLRECHFSHELAKAFTVTQLFQNEDYMFFGSVVQFLKTKVDRADAVDEFVAIMNQWRVLKLSLVKTDHAQVEEVFRHYRNWKLESVNMSGQMLWDMVMIDAACWPRKLPRWVFWFYRLDSKTDAFGDLIAVFNTHTQEQFELVLAICVKMFKLKRNECAFEFSDATQSHYKLFRGDRFDNDFGTYLELSKTFFRVKDQLDSCETTLARHKHEDYVLLGAFDIIKEMKASYKNEPSRWELRALGFLSQLLFNALCSFPERTKEMRLRVKKRSRIDE